jgi:ABC-2 type transport system permease protein
MNNNILLLKTLLLSTSQRNILKHSQDKKKKKQAVAGFIGAMFLFVMIMMYSIFMCVGYAVMGMIDEVPGMCAFIISVLAFVFTVFKTNGYLFNFKEYDMLMSLPFESGAVAGCKFLYMYIKSLPWYLSISFAMMIAYGFVQAPSVLVYPTWIILSFVLPIIPMLVAAFIGFLIARVSSGFKKTNLIQTILTFIFIIFCFSLRYIVDALFKDDKVGETLEKTSKLTKNIASVYLPMKWFWDAVTKTDILSFLLLIAVSALLFAVVFKLVGKSYRNINSALKSHAAAKNYKMEKQKRRSVVWSIAYKELKRMTGSTTYITNAAIGELMAVLLGLITLVLGFDKIVSTVTAGAPIDANIIHPAIPFIVYFLVGMMSTTACSPSLEGKNYWIVQSLPLEKKTLYRGKMLFNMCLTVPFMVFGILCLCISAKVPVLNTILYLILGIALCAFSTAWGCVCGIKHIQLEWENEVEVVKQGHAVALYLLPNMFVVMGLVVLVVYLGTIMNSNLLMLICILVASGLALLSYLRALSLAEKTF